MVYESILTVKSKKSLNNYFSVCIIDTFAASACSFMGLFSSSTKLFHDRGPCHIETSLLIFGSNKWTGFHIIGTSVMKELKSKKDQGKFLIENKNQIRSHYEVSWILVPILLHFYLTLVLLQLCPKDLKMNVKSYQLYSVSLGQCWTMSIKENEVFKCSCINRGCYMA